MKRVFAGVLTVVILAAQLGESTLPSYAAELDKESSYEAEVQAEEETANEEEQPSTEEGPASEEEQPSTEDEAASEEEQQSPKEESASEEEQPASAVENKASQDTKAEEVPAEEQATEQEAVPEAAAEEQEEPYQEMYTEFENILADHDLIALVYNCTEYAIKQNPDMNSATVATLGSGQQLQLLNVVAQNNRVWYQVEFAVLGQVYQGYIENANTITSDMYFTEWKEKHNVDQLFRNPLIRAAKASGTNLAAFPASYRSYIQKLINAHPNWTFIPFNTGLNWDTVISNEMVDRRNLVPSNSMTSWKSMDPPHFNPSNNQFTGYDSGRWNQASSSIVKYYMDPRNFLNEESVFQFELLTYSLNHTEGGVEALLKGSFMSNKRLEDGSGSNKTYGKVFMEIGSSLKVSPYFLASRVRQEQGVFGTSDMISGTYPGYKGIYNYFNIGASGNSSAQIIANGLAEAKRLKWTSRYASLKGGATKAAESYIKRGQDTLYLQKFDVDGAYDGTFYHQYMQNLLAADSESKTVKSAYASIGALNNSFVFKVPVYEGMPSSAYAMPKDTLKKPAISAKKNSETSGTLSWSEISGAHGYQIYSAASLNGSYSSFKKMVGISNRSYKVKITAGKTIYYKVRAYMKDPVTGKTIFSAFSDPKPIMTLVRPRITSAAKKSNGYVVLKWSRVPGSSGYRLYRKAGNGSYIKVRDLSGSTTLTYTDKKPRPNSTYTYVIKPYIIYAGKQYFGTGSPGKKITTPVTKTKFTSIKKDKNGYIVLKWAKITGVSGYRLYRRAKGGKYIRVKDFKGDQAISYTDKKPRPNTAYSYVVKAFISVGGKIYLSENSPIKNVSTKLPVAKFSSIKKRTSTTNTLKWKTVTGVSGYKIYRKVGKTGKYVPVTIIRKGTTSSYINRGLRNNKTYYYRIKAYRKMAGKTYFSAASPVTSFTMINSSGNLSAKNVSTVLPVAKFTSIKKRSSTTNTLKWKTVTGVTGYKIYRKVGKTGKYVPVTIIRKGTTSAYINRGLRKNRTYYYRIKTYRKIAGKTYFSAASPIKSFTMR